jgi:ribosomal protein S27E
LVDISYLKGELMRGRVSKKMKCEDCGTEFTCRAIFCEPILSDEEWEECYEGRLYGYYECTCKNNGNKQVIFKGDKDATIKYHCENLDKELVIPLGDYGAIFHPCDLCDYHGKITKNVICDCGHTHYLILEEN